MNRWDIVCVCVRETRIRKNAPPVKPVQFEAVRVPIESFQILVSCCMIVLWRPKASGYRATANWTAMFTVWRLCVTALMFLKRQVPNLALIPKLGIYISADTFSLAHTFFVFCLTRKGFFCIMNPFPFEHMLLIFCPPSFSFPQQCGKCGRTYER